MSKIEEEDVYAWAAGCQSVLLLSIQKDLLDISHNIKTYSKPLINAKLMRIELQISSTKTQINNKLK